MPDQFEKQILAHVGDKRYEPKKLHQLARDLDIETQDLDTFRQAVGNLVEAGHVVHEDAIALPPMGSEVVGKFQRNEKGFGFIIPDPDKRTAHGDLFVPAPNTMDAMTGDRVCAKVLPRRGGGRSGGRSGGQSGGRSPYIGRIVNIIQRADRQYVGRLGQRGSQWFVQVDGKLLREPVIIGDPQAHNAKLDDKVVIELLSYPSERSMAQGVITEVLGEQGEPNVETLAVMRSFNLKEHFDKAIMSAAREAAATFDPQAVASDRENLTNLFTLTIDPPDAKDFDDAISLTQWDKPQPDGAVCELGIHIADVSFFVTPGSALDTEALARGNSTYLPRRVIPMLPELLSNGVCSLQEDQPRFTKTAFIRYDCDGNRVGSRFCNGLIRSDKRLTYLEAQALIDGDLKEARSQGATDSPYPPQTEDTLIALNALAKQILARRRAAGMIELGLPEVQLIFDDTGRVTDAQPQDNAFTHRVIEMFMVEANEVTAELFIKLKAPMIRRVHPDPSSYDIDELRQFARVAGHNVPARPTRRELQTLLDATRDTPSEQAVHFAVLRTLSKAEYAPTEVGHFALASEHYTHFTSPIRRYPDLIVHRAIGTYLQKKKLKNTEDQLAELGSHCSTTERNSEAAERQLRAFLVLQLMEQFLGDDFDGTVTGVTGSGVFIQLNKYLVDGFIRTDELPGHQDHWRLNRTTGQLVAQRSGRAIGIGNTFTVRITRVNPAARLLDLTIIEKADHKQQGKRPKTKQSHRKGSGKSMKFKRQKKRK